MLNSPSEKQKLSSSVETEGPGIMDRFMEGLAPGDPGYEQLEPQRLSQTHFLHTGDSLDWDQEGGVPTTPRNVTSTSKAVVSPPSLPLGSLEGTQFYGESDIAESHTSTAAASIQGSSVTPPCKRLCDNTSCDQLFEDMPGTQLYGADLDAQLHPDVPCLQPCALADTRPVTSTQPCDDLLGLPGPQTCEDLLETQLYEGLTGTRVCMATQICEDTLPEQTLDGLPGLQPCGDIPRNDVLRMQIPADLPCSQVCEDLSCTQFCEGLPGTQVLGDLPGTQVCEDLPGTQVCEDLPGTQICEDSACTQVHHDSTGTHASIGLRGAQPSEVLPGTEITADVPASAPSPTEMEASTSHTSEVVAMEGAAREQALEAPAEAEIATVTPVRPTRCPRSKNSAAKGRLTSATSLVEQVSAVSAMGHSLQPPQQGLRIAVIGDGWGSREGGYEAVVTEADNYTFTVVATSGKNQWTESHVLRENCIFLSEQGPSVSGKASPARVSKRHRRS